MKITYHFEDLNIKRILFTLDKFETEVEELFGHMKNSMPDLYNSLSASHTNAYQSLLKDPAFFSQRTNKKLFEGIDYFHAAIQSRYGYSYNETINVEEVPLPAAAWLFGSALMGLYLRKNK